MPNKAVHRTPWRAPVTFDVSRLQFQWKRIPTLDQRLRRRETSCQSVGSFVMNVEQ